MAARSFGMAEQRLGKAEQSLEMAEQSSEMVEQSFGMAEQSTEYGCPGGMWQCKLGGCGQIGRPGCSMMCHYAEGPLPCPPASVHGSLSCPFWSSGSGT